MSWTRALDIVSWADTIEARHQLPHLLRRLVWEVVPPDSVVNFPAYEQIQRPGFDGNVNSAEHTQYVPKGISVWEIGTSKEKKKAKANEDFSKRTKTTSVDIQKQTTFVFVTPREWRAKDSWAKEALEQSNWKNVIAIDANDLEHWIERCPAVDIWFSTVVGRRPDGVFDPKTQWNALKQISSPPISPQVILVSRIKCCEDLLDWIEGEPSSLLLRSGNSKDVLDFLSALVEEQAEAHPKLNRMVFVESLKAWRDLTNIGTSLTLIATVSLSLTVEDVAEAVSRGHHVGICRNRSASSGTRELFLPRQESSSLAKTLAECGFENLRARSLSRACCGSSNVLKRLITEHPLTDFPEWANEKYRSKLAPFALLGGWVDLDPDQIERNDNIFKTNHPIDLICIEDFMGISRERIEEYTTKWCDSDEPLFLRYGNNLVIHSREDAWCLLSSSITRKMLERFEDLAIVVLEETNPALDLKDDEQWMANIFGKTHSLSSELRQGIIESLAIMTSYPAATSYGTKLNFAVSVRKVLSSILPNNGSKKRWATFSSQLSLFAEADPDFLLSRISDDLNSDNPLLPSLFSPNSNHIFSHSRHCGLLWALEIIAWSPNYLSQVADILAMLIKYENILPNNMSNRPSETLKAIFFWQIPQTNATIEERITILRQLVLKHPEVGWNLLIEQVPKYYGISLSSTAKPRWRDWANGWSQIKAHTDAPGYLHQIAEIIFETASESPEKWAKVINGIFKINEETTHKAIQRLELISLHCQDLHGRAILWKALRELICLHQTHPKRSLSLNENTINILIDISKRIQPDDPVDLNEWLFGIHPDLPDIDESGDYKKYYVELNKKQLEALRNITSTQGWYGVNRLLERIHNATSIGWVIGSNSLLNVEEIELSEFVISDNIRLLEFAAGYIAGAFNSKEFSFFREIQFNSYSDLQAAKMLCAVPFNRSIWDWMETNLPISVCDEYWLNCDAFLHDENHRDVCYVQEKLLRACRPFTAINLLSFALEKIDIEEDIIFLTLESALSTETNQEEINKLKAHCVQKLVKHLQASDKENTTRLAAIEWGYLPFLEGPHSRTEPMTLINALQQNPSQFIDLLKILFRNENVINRDLELTDLDHKMIRHGHSLINAFSTLPGTKENGQIDELYLTNWISEVRLLAKKEDRIRVADHQIGELLSRHSKEGCKMWPPLSICNILEHFNSTSIFKGFTLGIYNSRGVTCRDPLEGGTLERALVNQYSNLATEFKTRFPNLSKAFRELARRFEIDAEREDEEAERLRVER
ncbi:hypothetical protein F1728_29375 [Gimesia benthica]|uniref:Uncharacterized protein n=1 Tax=Gimesia benthica TaxID=2608982 RepID=A0A6I6AJ95_9PLAN|nr:hypothetical protein [Gimesia benthica]QGQ26537.1 hypothetical protein F1728_29375 [Gimesia benthica]